jgi:hypothetical protein
VGGFLGGRVVQMTLESFSMFGVGMGLGLGLSLGSGLGYIGEHFTVEVILLGSGFFKRQGMLSGVDMIELRLGFVSEEAGELGKGDGLL